MSEGTLYPALRRLENKAWVEAYWGDSSEGGRRRYYRITETGKGELARKWKQWNELQVVIRRVTEGAL